MNGKKLEVNFLYFQMQQMLWKKAIFRFQISMSSISITAATQLHFDFDLACWETFMSTSAILYFGLSGNHFRAWKPNWSFLEFSGISRNHHKSQQISCNLGMDILREFLESSTIHGLTYISTARVGFCRFVSLFIVFPPDKVSKDSLDFSCLSWIYRGWNPHWQVLQGLARESYCHLNHHPPHWWPELPCCDHLSCKGLQHRPLPWPRKSWQWISIRWTQRDIEKSCLSDLYGAIPQGVCEEDVANFKPSKHGSSSSRISLHT